VYTDWVGYIGEINGYTLVLLGEPAALELHDPMDLKKNVNIYNENKA
jgi:hypothetical protein